MKNSKKKKKKFKWQNAKKPVNRWQRSNINVLKISKAKQPLPALPPQKDKGHEQTSYNWHIKKKHEKYSHSVTKHVQNKMKYYFLFTKMEGFESCYSLLLLERSLGTKLDVQNIRGRLVK